MFEVAYSVKPTVSLNSTSSPLRIFCNQLEAPDILNKAIVQSKVTRS